ncbi:hypothetical protein M8C21_015326, partial [Ambrosia artemisiifolia]
SEDPVVFFQDPVFCLSISEDPVIRFYKNDEHPSKLEPMMNIQICKMCLCMFRNNKDRSES